MGIRSRLQQKYKKLRLGVQQKYFKRNENLTLPITELLRDLANTFYVVLKHDVPYMPADFPDSYPIGKDLDILLSVKDFQQGLEKIKLFSKKCGWAYQQIIHEDAMQIQLRFLWKGQLHYLIDCTTNVNHCDLAHLLLIDRVPRKEFYKPSIETELLYRALEYKKSPSKWYHLNFLQAHQSSWNQPLADRLGIQFPIFK